MSTITLEDLVSLDLRDLKSYVENLRAVHDWARANLAIDYTTGERVEIVSPTPSITGGGWACYSEALAVGQSGVAGEISFSRFGASPGWRVTVGMDRCWSIHKRGYGRGEHVERFWCGPAADAPEGFTVPGGYPPEGKVKHFSMPVAWVRKAT